MNVVSQLANYEPVEVVAPYLDVDKNAILRRLAYGPELRRYVDLLQRT